MQNTEKNTDKDKLSKGKFSFKTLTDKLKEKDEAEVRSRLRFCVDFALTATAAFMLGSAELPFSTYPLALSLLCSHKSKLPPISLGLLLLIITGGLPEIYIFTCIACPLIRILFACIPSVFAELGEGTKEPNKELINYKPELPEKIKAAEDKKTHFNIVFKDKLRIFEENLLFRMLTSSICGLLAGVFSMIGSGFSFYSFWGTLLLTAACPAATALLSGKLGEIHKGKIFSLLSLFAILSGCVYAAKEMTVIGVPMSPFLAMLFTLYATSAYGIIGGGVAGIVFGLIFDPIYMPLLFISSLVFFLVSTVRQGAGLAVVCAAVVIWCYYIGGTDGLVGVLPPMLLAIPVYMLCDKYREMMYAPLDRRAAMAGGIYFAEAMTEKSRNEAVRERLGALSEVFSSLSETLYKLSDKHRRPDALGLKKICEREFDSSCKNCRNREICYGSEYKTVLDAIGDITVTLHSKGIADKSELDGRFISLCPYSDNIVKGINRALAEATESMIKNDKLGLFASSYDDINEILRDTLERGGDEYITDSKSAEKIFDLLYEQGFRTSGVVVWGKRCKNILIKDIPSADKLSAKKTELLRRAVGEAVGAELCEPVFEVSPHGSMMRLSSKPLFRAKCSHGSIPSGMELQKLDTRECELYVDPFANNEAEDEVCGDTANCFITSSSYFYSLISDGMGNGEEAAFVSGVCSMFVEKMLSVGNRADMTVRMLNNLLRSENMCRGGECSATVDLCELDLITGTASFIKSGAAPTYIARGGTVYKVHSRTMPIGILKDVDTKISKFDTKKGDIIIMLSDGCCPDSDDCPWLVEFLCEYMGRKDKNALGTDSECENLKDKLLALAVKSSPCDKPRDDISVAVIMVD